jgi:hypothetical protein
VDNLSQSQCPGELKAAPIRRLEEDFACPHVDLRPFYAFLVGKIGAQFL